MIDPTTRMIENWENDYYWEELMDQHDYEQLSAADCQKHQPAGLNVNALLDEMGL